MTQYRDQPDRISNYFDRVLKGVGKRGSSFTDVDAVTHDADTDRFLFQEFKGPHGVLSRGQTLLLKALARKECVTVWCVRLREDGRLDWCDVASRRLNVIDTGEYRQRFLRWWNQEPIVTTGSVEGISADDISW